MTGPGKGRYTDYVHPLAEQSLKLTITLRWHEYSKNWDCFKRINKQQLYFDRWLVFNLSS